MKNCNDVINLMTKKFYKQIGNYIFIIILFLFFVIIFNLYISVFIVITCVCVMPRLIKIILKYKKFKKIISTEVKVQINKELANIIFECCSYILTENYIIDIYNYNLIKYDDILLITKKNNFVPRQLGSTIRKRIYMVTKTGNYSFDLEDFLIVTIGNFYTPELYNFIKIKNPNVIENDTISNKRILKEKFGIKLSMLWKTKVRFMTIYQ